MPFGDGFGLARLFRGRSRSASRLVPDMATTVTSPENYVLGSFPAFDDSTCEGVIHCLDRRFRRLHANWIDQHVGNADPISHAGGAKWLIDPIRRAVMLDDIALIYEHHGVRKFHVINHLDCGAYGGSGQHASVSAEREFHMAQCQQAAEILLDAFPDIVIHGYVASLQQGIVQVLRLQAAMAD